MWDGHLNAAWYLKEKKFRTRQGMDFLPPWPESLHYLPVLKLS